VQLEICSSVFFYILCLMIVIFVMSIRVKIAVRMWF